MPEAKPEEETREERVSLFLAEARDREELVWHGRLRSKFEGIGLVLKDLLPEAVRNRLQACTMSKSYFIGIEKVVQINKTDHECKWTDAVLAKHGLPDGPTIESKL